MTHEEHILNYKWSAENILTNHLSSSREQLLLNLIPVNTALLIVWNHVQTEVDVPHTSRLGWDRCAGDRWGLVSRPHPVLCLLQHDSLDLFSAEALAQLTAQSKTIYSPSAIQEVLKVIGDKKEPLQYLSAFLKDFNALVLKVRNPSVCDKQALGKQNRSENFQTCSSGIFMARHKVNEEDKPKRSSSCFSMILISVQPLLWFNFCAQNSIKGSSSEKPTTPT